MKHTVPTPPLPGLGLALLASLPLLSACGGTQAPAPSPAAARESIVAMARLEPLGSVHRVAAGEEGVLGRVVATEGAPVKAGDPIAYLASHALREDEVRAARLRLERSDLASLEIEAQAARLRMAEAEAAHYESEVERQKALVDSGLIPGRQLDATALQARRSREAVTSTRAELDRLRRAAELGRRDAEVALSQAQALRDRAVVRSPIDGVLLKMMARSGERVGPAVAQVGATGEMTAVAEVHANDIRLVAVGQMATFVSPALAAPLTGRVTEVGALISRNDVFGEDPTAPANARVFQVVVRLDDGKEAGRYTNLEGQVRILLQGAGT